MGEPTSPLSCPTISARGLWLRKSAVEAGLVLARLTLMPGILEASGKENNWSHKVMDAGKGPGCVPHLPFGIWLNNCLYVWTGNPGTASSGNVALAL